MAHAYENERTLEMTALKALAHPLRVQLLDALSAYGPATASALADRLSESSGATSYHLRQLEKHGFVTEDATRGNARERWWQRVQQPISLSVEGTVDTATRAASELVMAEWQRTRATRLREFLAHGLETLGSDWLNASGIVTSNVQLTQAQSSALLEELSAVLDKYLKKYRNQSNPGARPFQIHLDVFPIVDGVEQPGVKPGDVSGSGKDQA
ncbi:MAG: helix-turn-helix domain-containing protein [Pseudolysinimonas sp.]|uniref:helix-turn-helix domain-containing protein n=1 Tax=Pseudolysinimonas sp. TaxID=2680009 RepID=UPI003266B855